MMESLGHRMTDSELDRMFDKIDIDGSGAIDFSEFVSFMRQEYEVPVSPWFADLIFAFRKERIFTRPHFHSLFHNLLTYSPYFSLWF